jgi:CheY-like chemotaxis protein
MAEAQSATANPGRILVVDDELVIATTLAVILQQQGFVAAAAFSGEEAVELAKKFKPDFLVMDVVLPGMDGIEAAERILRMFPTCKLLFVSGNIGRAEVMSRAQALGLQCEMAPKPVAPPDLIAKIKDLLRPLRPGGALILNVDDSEVHRYLVSELLKRAGFKVEEASTGQEAVAAAAATNPDVIVLDVNLPDLSGFDVCRRLKSQPATARIPVVFLTGTAMDDESRGCGMAAGAADYLTFPVNPETLCALVARLAARRKSAPE